VASQDIAAGVAKVGERLSCTYRRAPQMTLKARPAEAPTRVAGIRLPRLVKVVCTGCQHIYQSGLVDDLVDVESGSIDGPRWGSWIWIAELGVADARVRR
jgi:hypothetical protein